MLVVEETCLTVSGVGTGEVCYGDWGIVVSEWEWEGVDDVVGGIGCVVSELYSLS